MGNVLRRRKVSFYYLDIEGAVVPHEARVTLAPAAPAPAPARRGAAAAGAGLHAAVRAREALRAAARAARGVTLAVARARAGTRGGSVARGEAGHDVVGVGVEQHQHGARHGRHGGRQRLIGEYVDKNI